ncbi:hypothetical protein DVH24_027468 [Malus domestica]|uniref:Uncharacterized protein n=1 Tax=Malus domestica TaxID=3750 RepID=A0A498H7I1_MALDO|nr:hypothetical protein DVH24_027468 [Malus domestica]
MGHMNVRREMIVPGMMQPLRLFWFEIEPSVGDEGVSQEPQGGGEENIMLSLTSGDFGELARERGILLGPWTLTCSIWHHSSLAWDLNMVINQEEGISQEKI